MIELANKIAEGFIHRDDITGIHIGRKRRAGRMLEDICVSIRVREKLSPGRIPPGQMIPRELLGLPTDVIEQNLRPAGSPYDKFNVVQGGIAIGPEDTPATTGTAGMVAYDASDFYNVGFLTCYHVVVVKLPDNSRHILQPSLNEEGVIASEDRVGTLSRYLLDSRNDSAIVKLSREYAFEIFPTNEIITSTAMPEIGQILEKCGCATGVTRAEVDSLGSSVIDFGEDLGGEVTIQGFSSVASGISDLAEIGDSGSVYYRPGTGIGVGLLTSFDETETFSCYLPYVISDLNLVLSYTAPSTTIHWSEVAGEKQLYWIKIGDEMFLNFTIAPENDLYHVYLFTTSAFADGVNGVMWGKRSTDSEYMLIGPHSMSPSCFIGDVFSGESITINLKLLPTSMLSELTEYEIPVFVGHGSTLRGGYA